jgi:type IV pilus assembly protein PilV
MQNRIHRLIRTRRLQGFTLMEVLISMLVLSVGVLGVAGMQITSLKNLQSSGSFGVAAMLAHDISERMWVNQAEVLNGNYDHDEAPAEPPDCVAGTCTSAEIAVYDINDWQQQITGYTTAVDLTVVPPMLYHAYGSIEQVGATTAFVISIFWDDDRSGSDETDVCPPVEEEDLDCYQLTVTY